MYAFVRNLRNVRRFKHDIFILNFKKVLVHVSELHTTYMRVKKNSPSLLVFNDFDSTFSEANNHMGALVDAISVHLQPRDVCYTINTEWPINNICFLN